MTDAALADVLVVDLTANVSGAYAGKLLADLGARVVLVEPPTGSPLRARPPARDSEDGVLFQHLSGAKLSIVPDSDARIARDRLADLLWSCDVAPGGRQLTVAGAGTLLRARTPHRSGPFPVRAQRALRPLAW